MITEYRYSLQKYQGQRTRHTCPSCKKAKEFTLYIDNETGDPLAPHVGKCNRENSCVYHYTPREYFRDNPQVGRKDEWRQSDAWKTSYQPPAPVSIDYLPWEVVKKSLQAYDYNNFIRFLVKLFGKDKAHQLARAYYLGTAKHWKNDGGYSVVFWQIDRTQKVRQAKVMAYDPETGRRIKAGGSRVFFMGKKILNNLNANLQQCLFGEHLLLLHEDKPVVLVESEKTAVIMAGILEDFVWLATGGKNGARWKDRSVYEALSSRKVIIYPDLGAFSEWEDKAKILVTVCDYQVSDLLEKNAQGNDWQEGYDLADYFIKRFLSKAEVSEITVEQAPKEQEAGQPEKAHQGQDEDLPEGWHYLEEGEHRILLDEEGLPAIWNYRPKNNRETLAIMKEENPLVGELIERFGLELEN